MSKMIQLPEEFQGLLQPMQGLLTVGQQWMAKLGGGRYCRRAQVPLVCPHSLRGLHASLALTAGATARLVAEALGHGSFGVTARHDATAESVAASRAARVTAALGRKEDAVSRLLGELSPAQREKFKKRLA